MAIVYLVHGLPGTGKTEFAKKLVAESGAVLLNHDEIRIAIFGRNPPSDRFEEYTIRIHVMLWTFAEKFLRQGISVILDHGFWTRTERDDARQKSLTLGAEPRFYEMVCSASNADARVIERNRSPEALHIPVAALDDFRSRFEPMSPDEERISVNTERLNQTPQTIRTFGPSV